MGGVSDIRQLKEIDKVFQTICEELDCTAGTIFRIAHQYLPNWGINVRENNREFIKKTSVDSYGEWKGGNKDVIDAIVTATNAADLESDNEQMNTALAELILEILQKRIERRGGGVLCDIGAGSGKTTIALLDVLNYSEEARDIASQCHFYLLEPSMESLVDAKRAIQEHEINERRRIEYTYVVSDSHAHLPMIKNGNFDLVYANAVFHHMSFPDHLKWISEKLKDDGVLAIGDWYTTIWQHPGFTIPLLKGLGITEERLEEFKILFDVRESEVEEELKNLTIAQKRANEEMVKYEIAIARELGNLPGKPKLNFLEAHESRADRVANLQKMGFEVDYQTLKKKHDDFAGLKRSNIRNSTPNSEFASVIAAGKIFGKKDTLLPPAVPKEVKIRSKA